MNMVDEAKLQSPIHLMTEPLVMRGEVVRCHGKELGPFC